MNLPLLIECLKSGVKIAALIQRDVSIMAKMFCSIGPLRRSVMLILRMRWRIGIAHRPGSPPGWSPMSWSFRESCLNGSAVARSGRKINILSNSIKYIGRSMSSLRIDASLSNHHITGCCIMGQTPLMQWLEVIIARLVHHWDYRWSNWPRYVGTWFAPPSTPDFSGEVNLTIGLVTSCCSCQTAWWRPACCWLGWGLGVALYKK